MKFEIEYSDHGWVRGERHEAHGQVRPIETQRVWKQIEQDRWLAVDLIRLETGFQRTSVYIEDAWLNSELSSTGKWRTTTQVPNPDAQIVLTPNAHARNTLPPVAPKPADNAAMWHIAKVYAVPGQDK